ncbi:MAG: porin family protein [bacterium]
MKTKSLLVLVLVLLMAQHAIAQKRLGVVVGVNLARFHLGDEEIDLKTRTGFGIGGIFDFVLTKTATVRLAPFYIQKGAKQDVSNDPQLDAAEIIFKITYFEVPVFLKIGSGSGPVRPYGLFGPSFGFNVSSEREIRGQDSENITDIETAINLFDIGVGIGGGLSFPVSKYLFFIEGRYALSILNVHQGGKIGFREESLGLGDEIKNRGIQLMAGFSF